MAGTYSGPRILTEASTVKAEDTESSLQMSQEEIMAQVRAVQSGYLVVVTISQPCR